MGALLAVAGCGAGQQAQTARQVSAVPGVSGSVPAPGGGRVQLLNVSFDYPGPGGYQQGQAAPLSLRITNEGTRPVTLVRVDAGDAATGAAVVTGAPTPSGSVAAPSTPAPTSPSPGMTQGGGIQTPPAGPSAGQPANPSQNPPPIAIPQPSTAPTPAGGSGGQLSVVVPPAGIVQLTRDSGSYLQLTGLTRNLPPGEVVPVTFTFDTGGTVTLPVPVGVPESPPNRPTPIPGVSEAPAPEGSPGAE